jgi:hypothetical protein
MIDPFTALAAVKAAVSAGQELVNVTKQIGDFFDGVDDLRNKHEKKKNSPFASADENAMDTFVKLQQAKDAEEELRQIVIATRGFSAWQELLDIRARIRRERKEREAAERLAKQERFEAIMIYGGVAVGLSIVLGITVVVILGMQGRL